MALFIKSKRRRDVAFRVKRPILFFTPEPDKNRVAVATCCISPTTDWIFDISLLSPVYSNFNGEAAPV